MTKEQYNQLQNILEGLDCADYLEQWEDVNSYDELYDKLNDVNAFQVEIIYYATAMEYLKENDVSLRNAMEAAADLGYETKDLNSELLASVLASQNAFEDFYDLKSEIEAVFE